MKKRLIRFHTWIVVFIIFCLSSIITVTLLKIKENRKQFTNGANIVYQTSDVLGISTETASIIADFSNTQYTGSPLVFGGAHAPRLSHQAIWDQLQEVGVTSLRRDFYIESELPNNITLEDFRQNKNDIQNPKNWNWTKINETNEIFKNAKHRGMKVIGILSYNPAWLTHSNTTGGVPKDWNVYEQIVRELYRIHRNNLDYIEIWNELDLTLKVNNTLFTPGEAYSQLVDHASRAIKEVDAQINDGKRIPIIAGVVSSPLNSHYLRPVLRDYLVKKNFDILSFHTYGHEKPVWTNMLTIAQQTDNLPVMITEWNQDSYTNRPNPYIQTSLSIPYTAKQLVSFLQSNIINANYFSLTNIDPSRPHTVFSSFGFYKAIGDKLELLPHAKTWRLMSRSMALGEGTSQIYNSGTSSLAAGLAFRNIHSVYGLVLVNDEDTSKEVTVTLNNIPLIGDIYARAYMASETAAGDRIVGTNKLARRGSTSIFKVVVPPQAIIGITLTNQPTFGELIKNTVLK